MDGLLNTVKPGARTSPATRRHKSPVPRNNFLHGRHRQETVQAYSSGQQTPHRRQEAAMNHSIHSADRSTHLKIVVVALVAGIAVAGFGIAARTGTSDGIQTARVIKAGQPTTFTSANTMAVR